MSGRGKIRLDALLVERGYYANVDRAARAIHAREVTSPELSELKPGTAVRFDLPLRVQSGEPFVSRGGEKLQAALQSFALSVNDLRCLDVGASTGGFSDCLLQAKAAFVEAVDVGYGQFDWRLRQDPRVLLLERTNIRNLRVAPENLFDLVAVDLSFTRVAPLLAHFKSFLKPSGQLIVLIKPQFELGFAPGAETADFEQGIVRSPALHKQALRAVLSAAWDAGFTLRGLIASPLKGADGNREFLFWATAQAEPATIDIDALIEGATTERVV